MESVGGVTPVTGWVTCIVATNRPSEFLDEALDSVAAQTYPHIDVIVVDDGSPDPHELDAVVARHPHVEIIRLTPHGVAYARNYAAKHARGEFLAFLDDDDRWHPERIALQVAALSNRADAPASYGDLRTINVAGQAFGAIDQFHATSEDMLARRVTVMLPNLLVRASAFHSVGGFDRALTLAEDLDLVISLVMLGTLVYAPGAMSDYRTHEGNVTRRHQELAHAIKMVVKRARDRDPERNEPHRKHSYSESLRANDRFAWWSAGRAARAAMGSKRWTGAIHEVWWAVTFAPCAPVSALWRRVKREPA